MQEFHVLCKDMFLDQLAMDDLMTQNSFSRQNTIKLMMSCLVVPFFAVNFYTCLPWCHSRGVVVSSPSVVSLSFFCLAVFGLRFPFQKIPNIVPVSLLLLSSTLIYRMAVWVCHCSSIV